MHKTKVLIVDDEANIRTMVQACLEDERHEILQASNGLEALAAVEEHMPDVMILDLAMPLLDGLSVLAEMKQLWSRLPTRVIVVTAHGSVKTAIGALRLGASDFVEKPFSPDELRQSVLSLLYKTALHRDPEEGYAQTLLSVRRALQQRQFAEAEGKLMRAGTITTEEPWFLNLAGVLHESLGRVESARKFYSRAVGKERHYRPAQLNLERLGQIRRTGRSKTPVAFGGDDVSSAAEDPQPDAGKIQNLIQSASSGETISSDRGGRAQQKSGAGAIIAWSEETSRNGQRISIGNRVPRNAIPGSRLSGAVRRLADWRPRKASRANHK